MSRIDELANMVYELDFTRGKTTEQTARALIQRYDKELRMKINAALLAENEGQSPDYLRAVEDCVRTIRGITL
jgi:hypothetical protein